MTDVKWPSGYLPLKKRLLLHSSLISSGTILALDPASGGTSLPGFAIFEAGILVNAGVVEFPKKKADIYGRLQYLYDKIAVLLPTPPDILAIEEVNKSMSHQSLQWAIGVSIAAARAPLTIEVPINLWRAVSRASPDYAKSDAADAVMIGKAVVLWSAVLAETA